MTETPETLQQHRQPGVRYKTVTVERPETTVIDGRPSTRMVRCNVEVALPPRDWDEIIRRGVTGVAVAVTLLAAAGTTASVGGLLSRLLHPAVAYSTGLIFTASWLACLGIEQIERVDAARANRARVAGWVMLLIGMGAVITYGHEMQQLPAGVVGSSLDLAAKGLWWLIMGLDRVKLDPGVAHWVAEEEQQMAGRFLLGTRLARLNRRAAAMRAAGTPEFQAAEAILAQAASQAQHLPAADTSGQAASVSVPLSVQVPATVPGQGPDPSGPTPGAPTPPPVAPTPPPSAPVPPPAAPVPPAPPVTPAATGASGSSGGQAAPTSGGQGAPGLRPVGLASKAQTVRDVLAQDPTISDADLIERVKAVHGDGGDPLKFADTVTRTRRRQENRPASQVKKTRSAP
ncbi:hypothetical protein [Streptomyces sp. NPDC001068]|uniref:hypothetical protein n=1 Tax=Streptomyces sp. NPDC001068 TaxID=3364544 RepID=UPI003673E4D5